MAVDVTEYWLQVIAVKLDRLIELGENVERASRSHQMPEEWGEHEGDHFADANKMVAEEPPKKWRILDPAEVVQDGDWMSARVNLQEDGPPGAGWFAASSFYFGKEASVSSGLYFARTVSDEPAKEPEPEYREPVLPADAGQYCQFSDDGVEWRSGWLNGWVQRSHQWISHSGGHWRHCRIKKES